MFRAIFGIQKVLRDFGILQCHRQPCQKQPSTKTARRSLRNTKSGLPGNCWLRRQPLIPYARKIEIALSSVALLPFERTAAITRERCFRDRTSAINALSSGKTDDTVADFVPLQRHGRIIAKDKPWCECERPSKAPHSSRKARLSSGRSVASPRGQASTATTETLR